MKMVQVSQKRFDELFDALRTKLVVEQYVNKLCKCAVDPDNRPVENMYRHMNYHLHGFKKAVEEA